MGAPRYLHTFGYQGLDQGAALDRLRSAGVQLLIDVRELPLSRKAGFSRLPLGEALQGVGIDYQHWRALGCPKPIRERYRRDGDADRYVEDFNTHLGRHDALVRELARLATLRTTCLLCFETDPLLCHRRLVAAAAREHGAPPVEHLHAEAFEPRPAQPPSAG